MNKEQLLREEFEKEFYFIYDHGYAVHENQEGKEIADWWLDKMATHQTKELADLREKVEGMKKEELTHADIQLLDRHEREEYNEDVVGYNQALDDVLALFTSQE